jgi:DNA-binding transcriptional ArsR family regulator
VKQRINPYRLFVGSFVPNWLLERTDISDSAKLLYARLSQYAGENGFAFPLIETLAKETGASVATVKRGLTELKEHGLIESQQRGLGQSNVYFFLAHEWMKSPPKENSRSINNDTPEGSKVSFQESSNLHHIRESKRRESVKREDAAPPELGKPKSMNLPEAIKVWTDRIYAIDESRFARLAGWVRRSQKRNFTTGEIAQALEQFLPHAPDIEDWYPYLDCILRKIYTDNNRDQHLREHNEHKKDFEGVAAIFQRVLAAR